VRSSSFVVHRVALVAAALVALGSVRAGAQQTPAAVPAPAPSLGVGDPAPDFQLRGATRYGVLANPVRLSDMRGETVVIAFFYKARTKG
jgi:thioredoxin-dependent peroxiredoxin